MLKHKFILTSFLSLFIVSLLFVAPSCGPTDEDPEPTETETVTGYATDEVTHVHIKGTDPCPQPITAPIEVFCFKADEFSGSCDADSVSIDGHTDGLNIKFINGKKFVRLATSGSSTNATLEFTCGIAESFTQTYTLNFFKDGKQVDTETVKVVVTVN